MPGIKSTWEGWEAWARRPSLDPGCFSNTFHITWSVWNHHDYHVLSCFIMIIMVMIGFDGNLVFLPSHVQDDFWIELPVSPNLRKTLVMKIFA